MILLQCLTPKKDVQFLYTSFTVRQALEKMEFHRYGTIPVLDKESGKYLYSLSEGDFLWYLKKTNYSFLELSNIPLEEVRPSRDLLPASISASMEELYALAEKQNFVPILDDLGVFIGIVTRKKIMHAFLKSVEENKAQEEKR